MCIIVRIWLASYIIAIATYAALPPTCTCTVFVLELMFSAVVTMLLL